MKPYRFETDCISADGDDINEMKHGWESGLPAVGVTYRTMLKHCEGMLDVAEQLGYDRSTTQGSGITLGHDPCVGFFKGYYQGRPCYFFQYSGIEYVWVSRR